MIQFCTKLHQNLNSSFQVIHSLLIQSRNIALKVKDEGQMWLLEPPQYTLVPGYIIPDQQLFSYYAHSQTHRPTRSQANSCFAVMQGDNIQTAHCWLLFTGSSWLSVGAAWFFTGQVLIPRC